MEGFFMGSLQIESLRKQFQGMNTAQKKQFIKTLQQKLAGKNNAEYTKFLKECIDDYKTNVTVNSGSVDVQSISSASTQPLSPTDMPDNLTKWKHTKKIIGIASLFLVVILTVILVPIVTNNIAQNRIMGIWSGIELDRDDTLSEGLIMFTFESDGSFSFEYVRLSRDRREFVDSNLPLLEREIRVVPRNQFHFNDNIQTFEGRWHISGDIITITPNPLTERNRGAIFEIVRALRGSSQERQYRIHFINNTRVIFERIGESELRYELEKIF